MDRRTEHTDNLKRQIEKSRSTYLMMRDSGYKKSTPVKLKFAYKPAEQEPAEQLAAYILEKTTCKVEARETDDGWIVFGMTRPRKLSAATLGRWVHFMCMAGYRFDCLFDGWGARVSFD
jgi:hypothetical protein